LIIGKKKTKQVFVVFLLRIQLIGYKSIKDENFAKKEEKRLKKSKNRKYIEWYFKNKRP